MSEWSFNLVDLHFISHSLWLVIVLAILLDLLLHSKERFLCVIVETGSIVDIEKQDRVCEFSENEMYFFYTVLYIMIKERGRWAKPEKKKVLLEEGWHENDTIWASGQYTVIILCYCSIVRLRTLCFTVFCLVPALCTVVVCSNMCHGIRK